MFRELKNAAGTLKALKRLCDAAVKEAEREGLAEVGSEHFLLAAFALPDGTAERSFQPFGVDAEGLRAAIEQSQVEALALAGFISGAMPRPEPITRRANALALPASASGRAVLERLSEAGPGSEVLCGAHVILAAVSARRGVVPRVLAHLGIAPDALVAAASVERDTLLTRA